MNKKLTWVILILLCLCIGAGTYVVLKIKNTEVKPKETVEQTPTLPPTPIPTEAPKVMLPELEEYYNKNQDTIGWLKIDNTPIDYPVMFTPEENEFYLNKDFDKNQSAAGTLFIDENSKISTPNNNIIIYGHNMKNDTMFGSLSEYAKKSYYEKHPTITFNTLYDKGTYEIVGAFYAQVLKKSDKTSFRYYHYYGAETEEEYNRFIDFVKSKRQYDTGVETKYGDQFITLSTCSYHVENGRFAVVARRVEDAANDTTDTEAQNQEQQP